MNDRTRYFLCSGQVVDYKDLIKFPQAHIIGHLAVLTDEGGKVTALARWSESKPTTEVPPIHPVIDVYLIGDARRIRCRCAGCDNTQRWELNKAAFEILVRRYRKEADREPVA